MKGEEKYAMASMTDNMKKLIPRHYIKRYEMSPWYYNREVAKTKIWKKIMVSLFQSSEFVIIKHDRSTFVYHLQGDRYAFNAYSKDLYFRTRFLTGDVYLSKEAAEKIYQIRTNMDRGIISFFAKETCFLTLLIDTQYIFCWNKEQHK